MSRYEIIARLSVIIIVWGLFAIAAYYDPMIICGIFFPLAMTGMILKD